MFTRTFTKFVTVAAISALPLVASAEQIEDEDVGSTAGAISVVTLNLEATVQGTLRLTLEERNTGTDSPTFQGANPSIITEEFTDEGRIDFGVVDSLGNQSGAAIGRIVPNAFGAWYVGEVFAGVTFSGLASVNLTVNGTLPIDGDLGGPGTAPVAHYACAGQTDAPNIATGGWNAASYGLALATTAGPCANYVTGGTDPDGTGNVLIGTQNLLDIDVAMLIESSTANGDYVAEYIFTATPTPF